MIKTGYEGPDRRKGELRERILRILNEVLENTRSLGQEKMVYTLHQVLGGGEVVLFKNMFRELDYLLYALEDSPLRTLVHNIHFEAASDRENPDFRDHRSRA